MQQLKQPYFLLDYLYDKFKSQIKVIAAGSSDFYLNSIGEDALPGKKKIFRIRGFDFDEFLKAKNRICLLYTSDAADERSSVDLGGRRIIKKKKNNDRRTIHYGKNNKQ